jgi:hypothetical protein
MKKSRRDWAKCSVKTQVLIILATLIVGIISIKSTAISHEAQAVQKFGTLPEAKNVKPKMMAYVIYEANKAGIDSKKVVRLLKECENKKLDPNAYYVNKGGTTVDRGLFMINDYWHPEVSNECAWDWECSTKEFIRIYKKRGWGEWTCGRILNL